MKLFKIKPIPIKKAESIIKVKNFDAKQHKYCKAENKYCKMYKTNLVRRCNIKTLHQKNKSR